MQIDEVIKYQTDIERWKNHEELVLPKDEYAHVMSELNTHMSEKDRRKKFLVKPIGNYYYVVRNKGFDKYTIIGKYPIVNEIEDKWEGYNE